MTTTTGWGLIGASNIASSYMIEAIRAQEGHEVVSVLSSNAQRGQAFATEHGIAHAAESLADLLANPQVDAVYISTTNELHFEQAIQAAQAGKHVLCEKPLALDTQQAKEMVAVCQQQGVVLATNHHLRNSALFATAKSCLQSGAIGKVQNVRVFHAVALPAKLQTWRLTSNNGGGVVLDITVHDADTLAYLLDEYPSEVTALTDQASRAAGVEDAVMMVWNYNSGIMAQIHEGFKTGHAQTGIEILGEKGTLIGTNCLTQEPVGELVLQQRNDASELTRKALEIPHRNLYIEGTRRFVEAMKGEGTPAATGEDGVRSLAVALTVKQALASRCVERVIF